MSNHHWTMTREAILSAVFLINITNFTLQWMAKKAKDAQVSDRIRNLRFSVLIYGLLSLFGCNLVHSSILVAVSAWLVFLNLAVLHYMYFKEFEDKLRAIVNLILHGIFLFYTIANVSSFSQIKTQL